ncbi:ABC transporter permease [Paenibacillus glycinis]|uniref:ABC transporter permease subunit n=1 Tax=Paenibacillus glycinis TaxID=2697035 RepID=A0ABW9XK97_9BACL|nr:ABC transporter permease [Paenibacillus glycinis]NBD22983.1 ABC transporter permease subunit [Paenibacillus glycinis]
MKIQLSYVIRRVAFAIATLFAAIVMNFLLPRLIGGDPAEMIASQTALGSPDVANALRKQFGLDDPSLVHQFGSYIAQLLHGNLGISYFNYPVPVKDVLWNALPWTLGIVLIATLLSYAAGWFIGIKGALKPGSWFDHSALGVSFFINSVPYFWVGIMLILIFAYKLDWFPMGQAIPVEYDSLDSLHKLGSIAYHAVLPIASLALASIATHILVLRNNLIRVLSEDYMVLARAKGLSARRRVFHYGIRNAFLPSFTGFMLSLGHVVGGAITMEIVFSYPGIGMLTYNAILNHDYPLIQGAFLVIAVSIIAVNLLADLIYPLIDPRVNLN